VHYIPGGKWEGSRDYMEEKGDPIPWVVRIEGKERIGGLEFVVE
jgi:hypothetical protein